MGAATGKQCCCGSQDEDDLRAICAPPVSALQSLQEEVVQPSLRPASSRTSDTTDIVAEHCAPRLPQSSLLCASSPSDTTDMVPNHFATSLPQSSLLGAASLSDTTNNTVATQCANSLPSEESTAAPMPGVFKLVPIEIHWTEDPTEAKDMVANTTNQKNVEAEPQIHAQVQVDRAVSCTFSQPEELRTRRWYSADLQREQQEKLGLSIGWVYPETALTVSAVGNGTVQRWNLTNPDAAIQVGDAIVCVNDLTDPCDAARQLSTVPVLRLRLERRVSS
mmetsp:Transcript_24200/g.56207  ORF Transcript_24200/g.56207 Transcript_24200/m.56207 type:complete len:278 (+) Transcript_24200:107-940(+)